MNFILLFLIPSILAIFTLPFIVHRRLASWWSATLATLSFAFSIPLMIHAYSHVGILFFLHQWLLCDKLSAFFIGLNSFITIDINVCFQEPN